MQQHYNLIIRNATLCYGLGDDCIVADLLLFDPDKIAATATIEDPFKPSAGIHTVWVNGKPVWQNGASTAARPGTVLKRTVTN